MPDSTFQRDRLFSLFREMVDIYSPSNKEEEITAFLLEVLNKRGLPVRCQQVDETRSNLIICAGDQPRTLFLGHIDTVPAFDIEQYSFNERDGLCYGLGTADMKGGCAALIEAFTCAHEAGVLSDDMALALVVGEEETGDGTRALLESGDFERALVAEPTDLTPCLNHYGYVEMIIRVFGYRRHAAMSDRETNAIRALLRFLLEVETRIENNEPDTVLNIRDLHSAESGFAVPDRCTASLDLHLPPGFNAVAYAEEMRLFAGQWLANSRASRYEIDFPTLADGYCTDPQSGMAQMVLSALDKLGLPRNPAPFKSHSDANLLQETGCSTVIFGPGQLAKAHTFDESIDFKQVETAARVYRCMLG
ncbi:MAG: M20/M25/M40 family metallo-hydrolase [Kiritimatiellae bacterium]|nr:M20/M25/M40 family metallo-hydrolase [Kiritimatiellia bacterium]